MSPRQDVRLAGFTLELMPSLKFPEVNTANRSYQGPGHAWRLIRDPTEYPHIRHHFSQVGLPDRRYCSTGSPPIK